MVEWVIKHFDDKTLDHIRSRFDKESGMAMIDTFKRLFSEAIRLHNNGLPPDSEEGLSLAKEWWDMVMEFTGGDASLLPEIINSAENMGGLDEEWKESQITALGFLEPALGAYFAKTGNNPFEGVET